MSKGAQQKVVELMGREIVLQMFTNGVFIASDERTGRYLTKGQASLPTVCWDMQAYNPGFSDCEMERLGKALLSMYYESPGWEKRVTMAYQEPEETCDERRQRVRKMGLSTQQEAEFELLRGRVRELEGAFENEVMRINAALGGSLRRTIAPWVDDVVVAILRLKKDERGLELMGKTLEDE